MELMIVFYEIETNTVFETSFPTIQPLPPSKPAMQQICDVIPSATWRGWTHPLIEDRHVSKVTNTGWSGVSTRPPCHKIHRVLGISGHWDLSGNDVCRFRNLSKRDLAERGCQYRRRNLSLVNSLSLLSTISGDSKYIFRKRSPSMSDGLVLSIFLLLAAHFLLCCQ